MTNHNYTQSIIRPFRAWAISSSILVAQLMSPLVFVGCDDDGSSAANDTDAARECSRLGESQTCECKPGFSGTKVCLSDGTYSSCSGCYALGSKPCTDPGVEFSCACSGAMTGKQICLNNGTFTKCECPSSETVATSIADGSTEDLAAAAAANAATAGPCPSGFTCKQQSAGELNGKICMNGSIPTLCPKSQEECVTAGLSSALCIPVSAQGANVKVCAQLCN